MTESRSPGLIGFLRTAAKRLLRRGPAPLPAPGAVAPDFDLSDQFGERVRLADLRGRRVLLWFYPKAATPG